MLRRACRWLFSRPESTFGPFDAIAWWELRRVPFNVLVALYGLPCLVLFYFAAGASGKLAPGEDAVEPMALIVVPIAVNFLYTLGWLLEAPLRVARPSLPNRFGPRLFKLGLGLGLLLCTAPAAFALGLWLLP